MLIVGITLIAPSIHRQHRCVTRYGGADTNTMTRRAIASDT